MKTKAQKAQEAKQDAQDEMFGMLILCIGGGALLAALYFNSVIPIVVGVFGLFGVLAFINGLV